MWKPVVDKVKNRLGAWQNRYISLGGRVTLLKSVLWSLPIFYMSLYKMPMGVRNEIERLMKVFLWRGGVNGRGLHLVGWEDVTRRKEAGGIGMTSLGDMNSALLVKRLWRFGMEHNAFWRNLVCEKMGYSGKEWLPTVQSMRRASGVWRDIVLVGNRNEKVGRAVEEGFRILPGNGDRISFWSDIWVGEEALKVSFPRMFRLALNKNGLVSEFVQWKDGMWQWNVELRRQLFDWESESYDRLMSVLAVVKLSTCRKDVMIWKPNPNGRFSVASFCMELDALKTFSDFKGSFVWQGIAPPRIEVFCWVALRGRNPTKQMLKRRNILQVSDPGSFV